MHGTNKRRAFSEVAPFRWSAIVHTGLLLLLFFVLQVFVWYEEEGLCLFMLVVRHEDKRYREGPSMMALQDNLLMIECPMSKGRPPPSVDMSGRGRARLSMYVYSYA